MAGLQDLLTGGIFSADSDAEAEGALRKGSKAFDDLKLPEIDPVTLRESEYVGDVNPTLVGKPKDIEQRDVDAVLGQVTNQGDSEMNGISTDPRLRDAQMAALSSLQGVADSGGMDSADVANMSRIQNQTAQADKGRRDAILQGMSRRGMGGGGSELLAQLQSSQAATDRQSQEGLDIAGMAQRRALEAMAGAGSLGGSIRGQGFGEKSDIAKAQDVVNQFNAGNTTSGSFNNAGIANSVSAGNADRGVGVDKANIGNSIGVDTVNAGAINQAATGNRDTRQGVGTGNTNIANTETMHNANIPQQNFDNSVTKADGVQKAAANAVAFYGAKGQGEKDAFGNLVAGGAKMYAASDRRVKKDIKPATPRDLDEFLSVLQPSKFKYKSSKHGNGDHTGVMAQDLLKSKLGSEAVVQDDDGTLGYDKDKMQNLTLAALKHLADKINKKGS